MRSRPCLPTTLGDVLVVAGPAAAVKCCLAFDFALLASVAPVVVVVGGGSAAVAELPENVADSHSAHCY